MKKRSNALSFALGAVIGTGLAVYGASQQGIYVEAHRDEAWQIVEAVEMRTETFSGSQISEPQKEVNLEETQGVEFVSLGEFKLTAYCPCEKCCDGWALDRPVDEAGNQIVYGASGEILVEGVSIAVDKNVIPYGAEILVNGRAYKAQDCGGAIKGNRIDVYFDNHADALEFGVQYAEVFLKKGAGENGT